VQHNLSRSAWLDSTPQLSANPFDHLTADQRTITRALRGAGAIARCDGARRDGRGG